MVKIIELKETIFKLSTAYPEIIEIMEEVGFKDITNPVMLNTVGKYMTLEKGAILKKKDITEIKRTFKKYDFELI